MTGADEDGGGGPRESSGVSSGNGGPVSAPWRAAAELKMRSRCPATKTPGPATFLSELPQLTYSPGLYPGGFHPGRAELAHVTDYGGAAFHVQKSLKTRVRPHEAGLRILNHHSNAISQADTNYV